MPPRLLVTGSSGLIGSEVVSFFAARNWTVFGIDNNERARFFGPDGDTRWNQARLAAAHPTFEERRNSALALEPRAAIPDAATLERYASEQHPPASSKAAAASSASIAPPIRSRRARGS